MKLFVDDVRSVPDESWTLARTICQAMRAIKQFNPEIISLDHDIGHFPMLVFQRSQDGTDKIIQDIRQADHVACSENFTAVAEYIVERYKQSNEKPKIFIHTMNPEGAKRLAEILSAFEVERDLTYTPH